MTNNNKLCNVLFEFVRLLRTLLVGTPEQSPINHYRRFADLVEMCFFDGFNILIFSALLRSICILIFLTRSLHFALVSFLLTSGYATHKNELLE